MEWTKENLSPHIACHPEESSPLNSLLIFRDGSTLGTDGRILFLVVVGEEDRFENKYGMTDKIARILYRDVVLNNPFHISLLKRRIKIESSWSIRTLLDFPAVDIVGFPDPTKISPSSRGENIKSSIVLSTSNLSKLVAFLKSTKSTKVRLNIYDDKSPAEFYAGMTGNGNCISGIIAPEYPSSDIPVIPFSLPGDLS